MPFYEYAPQKVNEARGLIFCMNTHINMASVHVRNHKSSFFHFPVIDTYQFFCLKHIILIIQPKKLNEARELIFGMHAHIRIISTHAKDQRSSFFHFHIINTSFFLFEICFFLPYSQKPKRGPFVISELTLMGQINVHAKRELLYDHIWPYMTQNIKVAIPAQPIKRG